MVSFNLIFNLSFLWILSSVTGLKTVFVFNVIVSYHVLTDCDTDETLMLVPKESVHICPGEVLSYTCIARNATDVQWNIQFTRSFTADVRVTLIEDDPIAQLYNVTREGHVFSFNILSRDPMISELITSAATLVDEAVVRCRDVSPHNKNANFDNRHIFIIDQGEPHIKSCFDDNKY